VPHDPAESVLDESVAAARAAGLHYVTDTAPGVRRKRAGRGFAYYDAGGRHVRDRAALARFRALAIPPAWTDVWICSDPDGHMQVTARDGKGRKQYRYHPRFRAARDRSKFGRLLTFSAALPRIRDRVERDLARRGLPRDKVLATVVWLLERTSFRVGNELYAKLNRSYGLTTLRRRHVDVAGDRLRFEFRGKSGVARTTAVTDRRIARIVRRCRDLPGEELFKYLDDDGRRQRVESDDINAYLRRAAGVNVTAKDFRTWAGTMHAALALAGIGPAAAERDVSRNVNRALDHVAERLGNTRAVCRAYYVHPAVLDAYRQGLVVSIPPQRGDAASDRRARRSGALRHDEAAVLQFLQDQLQRLPQAD
jgi:DNA topoisomerase-1